MVDQAGAPVIGANVIVEGTTTGTTTDAKGAFSLEVPAKGRLLISYLGYETQQVTLTSQTQYMVTLRENTAAIADVVVVGYGVQRKESVVGAISQVNMNWSGYNESATTGGYNAKIAGRSWRRADYLRLKEVSVGYTWSGPKIRQALGVRALKVYATGNNLLTFTDLLEGDPENKYLVWGQYPQMMTVKLGIQVSF